MITCWHHKCKHYFEDNCIKDQSGKLVHLDGNGQCVDFDNGLFEGYLYLNNGEKLDDLFYFTNDGFCKYKARRAERDFIITNKEENFVEYYSAIVVVSYINKGTWKILREENNEKNC